jgi:hypothetical protein
MKFTFTAALLAVASGAAAAPADTASSVLPPPEAQSNALKGSLRGGTDRMFSRRLELAFPDEYESNGCLGDNFKDKCANCMCLNGPIGGAYPTKHCDLSAPGDGQDHCVDKGWPGSKCSENWECKYGSCPADSKCT